MENSKAIPGNCEAIPGMRSSFRKITESASVITLRQSFSCSFVHAIFTTNKPTGRAFWAKSVRMRFPENGVAFSCEISGLPPWKL